MKLARDVSKNKNRFSALVLAIVKSRPFQMNTKVQPSTSAPKVAAASPTHIAASLTHTDHGRIH